MVIEVNSLEDTEEYSAGNVTLRAALKRVADGGTILFDPELNGGTINLTIIGEENSTLRGELFAGPDFMGYQERNYGPSALYAQKNLTIDASDLSDGIRLHWNGGDRTNPVPARVIGVYGDLTLRNLTISGGYSAGIPLDDDSGQPYTLARGGGIAVWGHAILQNCTIAENIVVGDIQPARDRGAFGGGVYADLLFVEDCIISGNRVSGYGAAGGGVYSVGGAGFDEGETIISRTAITGNRISGLHTYGGGVYSDGGGRGNSRRLLLANCTVARNVVEEHPDISIPLDPQDFSPGFQFYFRGGGIYMSNGFMELISCTIVENEVTGRMHAFKGRPNAGGGGIAATIGDAHIVEDMRLRHSIITGNTLNGDAADIFTGSLMNFFSQGYNLVGHIDFSQILVPIPIWKSLNRRHWPKTGDHSGVTPEEVLSLDKVARHETIVSEGTDKGEFAVLWYPAQGKAIDAIPDETYTVLHILGETAESYDYDMLQADILDRLYNQLGASFDPHIETDLINADFHGPKKTWPNNPDNDEWISFWKKLDLEIGSLLGDVGLGDAFWTDFIDDKPYLRKIKLPQSFTLLRNDQRNTPRPQYFYGDIGAVEMDVP